MFSATPAVSSFSGFGASSAPAATTSSGFGAFGAPAAAPTATAFGAAASSTGFGSFGAAPAAVAVGAATATTPATTSSGFGAFGAPAVAAAPTIAAFGAATASGTAGAARPTGPIMDAIERLQRLYAPLRDPATGAALATAPGAAVTAPVPLTVSRNDECRFKAVMLSRRGAGDSTAAAAAAASAALVYGDSLAAAERDNTDPEHWVAVEELGGGALRARFDAQDQAAATLHAQGERVAELLRAVRDANRQLRARYELLKNKQALLNKRALAVMRHVEVLRCHGTPLQQSELFYRERMMQILNAIEQPIQKMRDMSINLTLQDVPEEMYAEDVSEEDLVHLMLALKKQSEGIEALSHTLRKDVRDVAIVRSSIAVNKR